MDTFKLLTCGTKFDVNKFQRDFQRFKKINPDNEIKSIPKLETESSSNNKSRKRKKFDVEQFRIEHGITVDGIDVKPPIRSFDELSDLKDHLKNNIENSNYHQPTPIQMQVIPLMLDQRQLIACAPTGSGKTLAFLLPILMQLNEPKSVGFRAIILTPTRELAKQIHREALWISQGSGLRIHLIKNVNLAAKKFNIQSKLKYDILITTPKRLQYLLRDENDPEINIQNLEWLIVDECDRLFQHTFLEQLASIFNVCFKITSNTKNKLKVAMFSATYDRHLHEWCRINLNNICTVVIGEKNQAVNTVEQKLVFTGNESGKLFALKDIINQGCQTPVLIFVNTVGKANYLQRELQQMLKINSVVDAIHSDRNQENRDNIVRLFREGKILFLICTELMGRGIDFKAVNLVINYDIPSSAISYIHHIGRTGRAGRNGIAITFYTQNDELNNLLLPILTVMKQSGCDLPKHLQTFDKRKMLQFQKLEKNKKNKKKKQTTKRRTPEHSEHPEKQPKNGNIKKRKTKM